MLRKIISVDFFWESNLSGEGEHWQSILMDLHIEIRFPQNHQNKLV